MIYQVSQIKYARLTSHDTDSITSISKIWLGLDRWDIELNYYTIAVFINWVIDVWTGSLLLKIYKYQPKAG